MAETTAVVPSGPIRDASKPPPHTSSSKLEDQAATAALYVTSHDKEQSKKDHEFLDSDHKLSSAGAAASLKYANPRDLPSFPSIGLKKGDASAAGTAASLGWANQKPFEHWKPDASASASAAAMKAKDYKMAPLWQPEASSAGAKAALLAHKAGANVEIWKPEEDPAWGHSAATQAMANNKKGLAPQLDYGHTAIGRQGSLMAATGAMSTSRKRSGSTPVTTKKADTYPDESNAVANALSAATSASRGSKRSIASAGGAVPYTNMSREMYTSNPPVQPEIDEKNHADTLHASAVAMARSMYTYQQKHIDAASNAQRGAAAAHHRRDSSVDSPEEVQPMRFDNLQEAAQKLAQERLAKLHDEHAQNREYRDYYSGSQASQSRMSFRGRNRNRASSLGNFDDQAQSNKIRAQMSQFSTNLNQVDAKKRQQDREKLIAAAQRNVTKSLNGMDEKVFADTGKIAPSLLNEWEMKAHTAAQAKSDTRMENHGKVHIGGGKFVDQSEIDAVAARNVQPVLDEINEKAATERERQAALKLEQETQQRKASDKKAREKESKEIEKKLKQQDKEEKKMERDDEKRAVKEKRKSGGVGLASSNIDTSESGAAARMAAVQREHAEDEVVESKEPVSGAPATTRQEPATIAERRETTVPTTIRTSMEDQASIRMHENADAANGSEVTPLSPNSTTAAKDSKVKNWLKTKFNRRMSKGQRSTTSEKEHDGDKAFIGGAALTGASANNSAVSLGANSSSVRDVATAEAPTATTTAIPTTGTHASAVDTPAKSSAIEPESELDSDVEVSPVSAITPVEHPVHAVAPAAPATSKAAAIADPEEEQRGRRTSAVSLLSDEPRDEDEEFQEARDNFDEDLAPPPTFSAAKSSSPARTAKFHEEI